MKKIFLSSALAITLFVVGCSDDDKSTDPPQPLPLLSLADYTAAEGNSLLFSVTLSRVATGRVIFQFNTQDLTAVANDDYVPVSGVDTINAGMSATTIIVSTVDDGMFESTETMRFVLSSLSGATFADSVAVGTITDDDPDVVSFATHVRPILQSFCAKPGVCHGNSSPGGGLFLGLSVSYDTVVNAVGNNGPAVVAGNASASLLYSKTTPTPSFPSRMPSAPPFLTAAQQDTLRTWIDDGALDN